jgi:serine/threonine protein kinase
MIRDENGQPFWIGDFIKGGGFGDAYACTDVWGNDLVAKVLKPTGTYAQVEARAIAEAEKLYQLRHPCVTHVFAAFEFSSTFYLITERCDFDLDDFFMGCTTTHLWLKPIAPKVLQALAFMHANGVSHCDLHAGNVFAAYSRDAVAPDLGQALTFKVGDFGVSKLLHELDQPMPTFKNSIRPPECIDRAFGQPGHGVDVYQAGMLFLEIALGKRFDFTVDQIVDGQPRRTAEAMQTPLGDVLARALRRTVQQRTSSAQQLWSELRAVVPDTRIDRR